MGILQRRSGYVSWTSRHWTTQCGRDFASVAPRGSGALTLAQVLGPAHVLSEQARRAVVREPLRERLGRHRAGVVPALGDLTATGQQHAAGAVVLDPLGDDAQAEG